MRTPTSGYRPNNNFFARRVGGKNYELTDHASTALSTGLGNVRATVTDRKVASFQQPQSGNWNITGFTADITSAQDYYPFGWTMPGRQYNPDEYRYSFNTQEKVDEIKGSGNHLTAKYWEYDPRIGRRWNMDPVVAPWESPYAVNRNNPLIFNDPSGDKPKIFGGKPNFIKRFAWNISSLFSKEKKWGQYNRLYGGAVETNKSGFIAKGGFITDNYWSNLLNPLNHYGNRRSDEAIARRRAIYERVMENTWWEYYAKENYSYNNRHIIPDFGKIVNTTVEHTGADHITDLTIWHNERAVEWGSGQETRVIVLDKPKVGDHITILNSLTKEFRFVLLRTKISDEFWEKTARVVNELELGFRRETLPAYIIHLETERNRYRMHVNYR